MKVVVRKLPGAWPALGIAANFVARREPFSRFPAGDLIRTLSGQIHRGHYLLAFDAASDPARVVGFLGWALYADDVAERFATSGVPPSEELADGGEVVWILTSVAENRRAFFALAKGARALYPTHRMMAVRHKPGGKRVMFDQSRARVRAKGGRERPPA